MIDLFSRAKSMMASIMSRIKFSRKEATPLLSVPAPRARTTLPGFNFRRTQHRNPKANARRRVKAMIGARQYRLQRKALARAAREQEYLRDAEEQAQARTAKETHHVYNGTPGIYVHA